MSVDLTPIQLEERHLRSAVLGNERRIWIQQPTSPTNVLCVLLDGEYYVDRMDAPVVLRDLVAGGSIPPIAVAYVSHVDPKTRWLESFCNPRFVQFLDEELIPWATNECNLSERATTILLGGLSLTGLAAAYAALHSTKVTGVFCQSASFWWNDCWLVQDVRRQVATALRLRISCGANETTEYVEHGPELIQRTSQVASNRAMRDALREKGSIVSYDEFDGGHDIESWKADLPKSIQSLLHLGCS